MTEFELLHVSTSLGHDVELASLQDVPGKVLYHLVLRGKIHLRHGLLELGPHFGDLAVKSLDLGVLGLDQETEVSHLILELAIGRLPLQVH